jgi:hypothetical protein
VPDVTVHIPTIGLSDITVELGNRDGYFLKGVFHLLLEVKLNGQVINKLNLLSWDPTRGVWDADGVILL